MVYDKFRSWITTGGQQDNNWYQSHNKDVYPIENLTPLNRDWNMANLYGNPKNVKKYTGKHILTFFLILR